MDKRCKKEIRDILSNYHAVPSYKLEEALEDIEQAVRNDRMRAVEFTKERRRIEAEIRRAEKTNPVLLSGPEKKMEPLPSVLPPDITWMYGSVF